jgi:hypothetical protein
MRRARSTKVEQWLFSLPVLFVAAVAIVTGTGCGDRGKPPPKLGVQNWKPSGIGGPVEVRPLPPSQTVLSNFRAWVASDAERKGRVYETTLHGASNQFNFSVRVMSGDTPMGQTDVTWVSFNYRDAEKGEYELFWTRRGRHNMDFLKLNDTPKKVWLLPESPEMDRTPPSLQIMAFEGLEPDWGVFAIPGGKRINARTNGENV